MLLQQALVCSKSHPAYSSFSTLAHKTSVHVGVAVTTQTSLVTQVGRLWTSLADYYIRRGMYETARDVYEEGLTTVVTVRDFSLIFDTLTQVGAWVIGCQELLDSAQAMSQMVATGASQPCMCQMTTMAYRLAHPMPLSKL